MPKLFLSPSGHFEILQEEIISIEDIRLVNLLREGNPAIVTVSEFFIPKEQNNNEI